MNKLWLALVVLLLLLPLQARPFQSTIFYHGPRLVDDTVQYLSKLAREPKGAEKVGKFLNKEMLTSEGREDALLRIAVRNGVIQEDEALGLFTRLSGVDGFSKTLRKIIGNKPPLAQGHMNELRIADRASQRGFSIEGIGIRFNDGIKKGISDIDVVIERNGTVFVLEAKDYASTRRYPMDRFRSDMETLLKYQSSRKEDGVIPVFSITRKPDHPGDWTILKKETERRGIKLIVGSPDEQSIILRYLERLS